MEHVASIFRSNAPCFLPSWLPSSHHDGFLPDVLGDKYSPNYNVGAPDTIDRRPGVDTVSYYNTKASEGFTPNGIQADLSQGTVIDPAGHTDQLIDIENINGSNFEIVIDLISLFVICPSFLYNESANPTEFV